MPTIRESIEAEVPAAFANREWSRFLLQSSYSDTPAASEAYGEGSVRFEPASETSSKVAVDIAYEETPSGESEAAAREHLVRTLKAFREFVTARCDETQRWTVDVE